MTLELEITVVNPVTGSELIAQVKIVFIGEKACTEIRPSRNPTPQEREALLLAVEETVRQETGRDVTRRETQMYSSQEQVNVAMRRAFGGGRG